MARLGRTFLLWHSLCLLLTLVDRGTGILELAQQGFEGLLVAIHKDVPESEFLLSNLQVFLSTASRQLSDLTVRTYFREVTILVPDTWRASREFATVDVDLYQQAEVRVVPQKFARSISTLQPRPCGKPGKYIVVPDNLIMHRDSAPLYMAPEYQFLHEWAKFRYGVFDELGIPENRRFPAAYTDGATVFPVTQCKNVFGVLARKDGTKCAASPSGILHPDCRLFVDIHNKSTLLSLLKMPYVAPVNQVAARYLPTKQNALCNRRSTWEIIFGHKDFEGKGILPSPRKDTAFKIVRPRGHNTKHVVLLLDTSDSMTQNKWVKLVHQGVARFIQGGIPASFVFGMLAFADEVCIAANLTRITRESRRPLRAAIPFDCPGSQAHAFDAVHAAIAMLMRNGGNPTGGILILVTDSTANRMRDIPTTIHLLKKNGLVMNTIALGPRANWEIEKMASATGGRTFAIHYPSDFASPELDSALLASSLVLSNAEDKPIRVKHEELFVDKETTVEVHVEKMMGVGGSVSIIGSAVKDLSVRLSDPKNVIYHETSPECVKDVVLTNWVHFSFHTMMPGSWLLHLIPTPGMSTTVTLLVSSKMKLLEEESDRPRRPVTVDTYISDRAVTFPEVVSVHALVMKGANVVVGATVTAVVDRPRWTSTIVTLRDNGVGADNTEGDGIYSAYFTQHVGSGRYGVTVKATGGQAARVLKPMKKDTKIVEVGRLPRNLTVLPKRMYRLRDMQLKTDRHHWSPRIIGDAGNFERVVDAGSFQLMKYDENGRNIPGAVTDLFLEDSKYKGSRWLVTLSWTSMGAHMDYGRASELEVRCSPVASELEENFREAFLIGKPDVVGGTLSPVPAGGRQELVIVVPPRALGRSEASAFSLYFALKTRNAGGQQSAVSNIVRVSYGLFDLGSRPKHKAAIDIPRNPRDKPRRLAPPGELSRQQAPPLPPNHSNSDPEGRGKVLNYNLISCIIVLTLMVLLISVFDRLPLYYGDGDRPRARPVPPPTWPGDRYDIEALFFLK